MSRRCLRDEETQEQPPRVSSIRAEIGDSRMPQPTQPTTDQMVRALAVAMRDKALADARQSMKMVRQIERDYGLTPATIKGSDSQQRQ